MCFVLISALPSPRVTTILNFTNHFFIYLYFHQACVPTWSSLVLSFFNMDFPSVPVLTIYLLKILGHLACNLLWTEQSIAWCYRLTSSCPVSCTLPADAKDHTQLVYWRDGRGRWLPSSRHSMSGCLSTVVILAAADAQSLNPLIHWSCKMVRFSHFFFIIRTLKRSFSSSSAVWLPSGTVQRKDRKMLDISPLFSGWVGTLSPWRRPIISNTFMMGFLKLQLSFFKIEFSRVCRGRLFK